MIITRPSVVWGALLCSPFAFAQTEPEYIPPIDVSGPAIVVEEVAPVRAVDEPSQQAQLFVLTEQLKLEVQQLRGVVEEQSFEIRRLQQQRLDDYQDFDRRIAQLSAGGGVPSIANPSVAEVSPVVATTTGVPAAGVVSEKEMYRQAYNLVKAREFDQAVPAFQAFLKAYPQGDYAGNAYYWLGELFVLDNDFTSAQSSMEALIAQFPAHRKVPDAYYKLAQFYMRLGDDDKAKLFANKVVTEYAGKADTLVQLAQEFLKTNYAE